jgi:hypothetical protein
VRQLYFGDGQELGQTTMVVQVPAALAKSGSEDALESFARRTFARHYSDELLTIPTVGGSFRPFTVQERGLVQHTHGKNILILGEAARPGSFVSGLNANLALTCDLNALDRFLLTLNLKTAQDSKYDIKLKAFDQEVADNSKQYRQLNLVFAYDMFIFRWLVSLWQLLSIFRRPSGKVKLDEPMVAR